MYVIVTLRHPQLRTNVYLVFPPGSVVLSAESYGSSAWTQTGCVTIELPNGDLKKYFMKVIAPDRISFYFHGNSLTVLVDPAGTQGAR